MIVYYTGTGNSRRCAQLLAARLEEPLVDAFPYLRGNKRESILMSKGEKIHDVILWMMILGALPFAKDLFLNLQYF